MSDCASPTYDYIRDPAAIYRQSFSTVRSEARLDHLPQDMQAIAIRLIHACGMVDLVDDLAFSGDAASKGHAALQAGADVLCDVEMVAHGIIRSRLNTETSVVCTLNDGGVVPLAEELKTTRSAAAVDLWQDQLEGSVVAIGNAPTALFHLLELIGKTGQRPAVILGLPVGFVGAAESKEALTQNPFGIPYITVLGRRGGSAMAAAAVNALAAGLPEEAAS